MLKISQEKQEILKNNSNTLVLANPGTGKTFTLALKYADLIKKGTKPEDILCLTFTKKARNEMENRILNFLKELNIDADHSKLNIHTFHSYAFESIDEQNIASSNLLRYTIFRYLKQNKVLNYSDSYLTETIVPKIENLIRYTKSYGILPKDIDEKKAREHLDTKGKNITEKELEFFLHHYIEIFKDYEEEKSRLWIDYADMLIRFKNLKNKPRFEYVLIDELQDVNRLEAQIAIESGKRFFAVGDKKQAIFGFQGGSISNFELFSDSKRFVLSENRRSTRPILEYSKMQFLNYTQNKEHEKDLSRFHNPQKPEGSKPIVYTECDDEYLSACSLAKKLLIENRKVAIIARTNTQILKLSKGLRALNIDYDSTYSVGSNDAKKQLILFLKGLLSQRIEDIRNSLFSPYMPISLQKAFELTREGMPSLDEIYSASPAIKRLRQKASDIENINVLFKEHVFALAVSYGKDHVLASRSILDSLNEALMYLDGLDYKSLIDFLESSELQTDTLGSGNGVVLSTVHKAKGREFDSVIYLPYAPKDKTNFADLVAEAVLCSLGFDESEEIEEEALRIDFVAFTRAENQLHIIFKNPSQYLNECCDTSSIESFKIESDSVLERQHKAFSLFLDGDFDGAKALLESRRGWVREYVSSYFSNLDHISFSSLTYDALEYMMRQILHVSERSDALSIGSSVHAMAEAMLKEKKYSALGFEEYEKNLQACISEIFEKYPEFVDSELKIKVSLDRLGGFDSRLDFVGKIDAVFRNGSEYLIVDWKTSKNKAKSSDYKQQLEAYKKAFCLVNGIDESLVSVAVAYVALRPTVNTGEFLHEVDFRPPASSAFNTFCKKVQVILSWSKDLDLFYDKLCENNDNLAKALVEEW